MAEGGGKSFVNPTFEPEPLEDDDNEDETAPLITEIDPLEDDYNRDETAPFFTSTPASSQYPEKIEMKTMQHEKYRLPDTSYV